jgi:hypothetical protein
MQQFVNSFKVTKDQNYVSIRGGKYKIPYDQQTMFHRKFAEAVPMNSKESTALVWVPPKCPWSALHLDFDIYMSKDFHLESQSIIDFSLLVSNVIHSFTKCSFGVFLTRKPQNTPQEDGFKGGFHMLFTGFVVTKEIAFKIREGILFHLEEFRKNKPIVGTTEKLFDPLVHPYGKNGMLLLGDCKPGMEPYTCFFHALYEEGWSNVQRDLNTAAVIKDHASALWNWNWKIPSNWKVIGDFIPPKVPYSFNLKCFQENTKGWKPGPEHANIIRTMCTGTGSIQRNKLRKKIVDLLNEHISTTPPNWFALEERIFPRKNRYTHYNQHIKFTSRERWYEREIQEFLFDIVSYISSTKSFVWSYYTNKSDKYNNQYQDVTQCISKKGPFTESDDFLVNIYPSHKKLQKILGGAKKANEFSSTLWDLSLKDAYSACADFLGYEPDHQVLMSRLLKQSHTKYKLRRFQEVTFRPYTGKADPHRSDQILNTFTGFFMESYIPKRKVDIKKTYIWRYLLDVFGHGEEGPLLEHFLKSLAFQVQHPDERSERITCIISPDQGIGKSQLFKLFVLLLGANLCMWHDSLDTYLTRFNWENKAKLIHFVDDIQGATKSETWKLFPKATSNFQQYEKKNEPRFVLPEYSNFFTTSNDESPLHIRPGDRRQVIYIASSKYKQDRSFFGQLNDEFQNLDVGHALFMMLKNMSLDAWHPTINPPSDARMRTIIAGMLKSHMFMSTFFLSRNWFFRYKSDSLLWVKMYRLKIQNRGDHAGQLQIRIQDTRLYNLFKRYMKEHFPSSAIHNSTTFFKEIVQLGFIHPEKRQELYKNNNFMVVDLYFSNFASKMKELYGKDVELWDSEKEPEAFVKYWEKLIEKCG